MMKFIFKYGNHPGILVTGKEFRERYRVAFFSFLTQIKKCFCNTGNIEVEKL